MKKRVSIEIITERLSKQNLLLDCEYLGLVNLNHKLICINGHRYITSLKSAFSHGCKICSHRVPTEIF